MRGEELSLLVGGPCEQKSKRASERGGGRGPLRGTTKSQRASEQNKHTRVSVKNFFICQNEAQDQEEHWRDLQFSFTPAESPASANDTSSKQQVSGLKRVPSIARAVGEEAREELDGWSPWTRKGHRGEKSVRRTVGQTERGRESVWQG